jgi:hypothetical protein
MSKNDGSLSAHSKVNVISNTTFTFTYYPTLKQTFFSHPSLLERSYKQKGLNLVSLRMFNQRFLGCFDTHTLFSIINAKCHGKHLDGEVTS